jgi:hypothetical protein
MGGASIINQFGVYGTLGVGSTTNTAGARAYSTAWQVGTLVYLYGGTGYGTFGTAGSMGDMWTYDYSTGQWAWIKGSSNINSAANHGTQGQSNAAVTPGGRSAAMCWKSSSTSLWLSCGNGVWSGFGNCTWGDLWVFNTATNNWTWVKGSSTPFTSPSYGVQGAGSATTDPGARNFTAYWTDNNGDFWFFGGESMLSANAGDNSDLWRYSVSNNQWIWVKGPSVYYTAGNYGTRYLPVAANNPPYRKDPTYWKDANGNFWLHGGASANTSVTPTQQNYADMWKLNLCGTVPPAPASISSNTTAACSGFSITLSTSSAAPYLFWINNANGSVVCTGSQVVTSFTSGVYTISAMSANNCSISANNPTATFTMYANPTISVSSTQLCFGSVFTISPSGAATYTYSGGSNTVSPVTTSSYAIVGSNAQGCVSSNTAICTVSVIPTPTVTVNSGSLCPGLTFTMVPTGATNYTFSTGSSIALNVQSSAVYTVIGAYPNGCRDTAFAYLTVYPTPTITAASGTICNGQSFTLAPGGAATYTFSSGSAVVAPTLTKTYTISGTSANGCNAVLPALATVTVYQLPNVIISSPSNTLCNGQLITFTATGAKFYSWTGGATTPTIALTFALGNITINVAAVDSNGCAGDASINLLITNCDGIDELGAKASLKAWPNPTSGELQLDLIENGTMSLYELTGKLLFQQEIESGRSVLNVQTLPSGIYLLEFKGTNTRQRLRISKTD